MKNFIRATSVLALLAASPAMAWEPAKPVEIVVAAGAGGASDQMARMMQAAIQKNNLMKQPMVVSLKGGASGAEALMYMKSSDGDANKVLIAYSLIYMLPLLLLVGLFSRSLLPKAGPWMEAVKKFFGVLLLATALWLKEPAAEAFRYLTDGVRTLGE